MSGSGGPVRLAIAILFVVLCLVAVGLGWARPGLFFYVATTAVGVLVWLDYEYRHRETRPDDHQGAIETTGPNAPDEGGGSAR